MIQRAIVQFRGAYDFLSNFSQAKVVHGGYLFPTVEHAYQAAKMITEKDQYDVWSAKTPAEAKRIARQRPRREDWDKVKLGIMEDLLRQKFENPELRKRLLNTGEAELVEGNTWGDRFWGVYNGQGSNHLGKLLMKIRREIRDRQRTAT